jgi:hypothetical protein
MICFLIVIGIATSLTCPPDLNGNNKTSGVILLIARKKISKGSICSLFFKANLIFIKKLKAHILLPRLIRE